MKKTLAILFVLIFLLAGAVYYFQFYREKRIDSWQMVPSSAILAYENQSLIDNWNKLVGKPFWETLRNIPYFKRWEEDLNLGDSLTGRAGTIDRLFRNRKFIVSVHVTAADEFDFLINLDLEDEDGKRALNKILSSLKQELAMESSSRTYQGYRIEELFDQSGDPPFTYFIYKNVFVGSFTPFLVEDVIRNLTGGFTDTFQEQITSLKSLSKLQNDEGNIYIDFGKFPLLVSSFMSKSKPRELDLLKNFSGDTYLDIKITDHELLLNGVSTIPPGEGKSFIGTFANQNPGKINLTDLVPNNTALLYYVSFTDFGLWQNQLTKYWSQTNSEQLQRVLEFEEKHKMNFDWVGNEAANAIMETTMRDKPDQLVFIEVKDKDKALDELGGFAEQLSSLQSDSVYFEMYDQIPIIQLPFKEFPAVFFGEYFVGFENSFVTIYNDHMIIGNSMKVVKNFLQSVQDEDVWGKSIRQNLFMENTLSESSLSMYVNTALCWEMLLKKLDDRWGKLFIEHEQALKSFDRIALQVSNLDQRFYTSIAVGHQERAGPAPMVARLRKIQSAYTVSPIITMPYIVRNHNNNKLEVLVQDSSYILYQVSNEGEILWGDSLQEQITTDIHQIDYYKNNKLQYLFGTKNKLHLLDRNGDYVANYPIQLPVEVELQHLSVIDYDNSKRYRFMAVDSKGNIYLYDKEGNNLDGWTPRPVAGPLAVPGFHVRVRGGDCMIALQENGVLNVMNRRGDMYPGFPVDLQAESTNDVFADIGNDFTGTKLVTVTAEGEVIEVNLKGAIISRQQLYKPSKESRFWLVPDALNKTFLVARYEFNQISLIDRNGKVVLEKNIISTGELEIQYYNFSSDNQIYVVIDTEQEFTYIFDKQGQAISFEPIESGKQIGLLYSTRNGQYKLYKCFNNNLTVEVFK